MNERIKQELTLLKKVYPDIQYKEDGRWLFIPEYKLQTNIWNKDVVPICFQIAEAYPGEAPYGFFVPTDLLTKDTNEKPVNAYTEPASTPFAGTWGKFSWQQDESWRPTADLKTGSNLLNFVRSFCDRFKEGK